MLVCSGFGNVIPRCRATASIDLSLSHSLEVISSGLFRRVAGADFGGVINQRPSLWMRPGRVGNADPRHIRAEIFDSDRTYCGALNRWATVNRDWPIPGAPLIYRGRRYGNCCSQRPLASDGFAGAFDSVHKLNHEALPNACQAALPNAYDLALN